MDEAKVEGRAVGPALTVRTEFTLGNVSRSDGWWVAIDADGVPFYEAGPFTTEQAAHDCARDRLALTGAP